MSTPQPPEGSVRDESVSVPEGSVSVVVPTIGRDRLVAAVASASAQTLPPLEIIVVDDRGPRPGLPGLPELPVPVTVVVTSGALGPGGARAAGAARATGELIAFLDDDDTWEPTKLAQQVRCWREHAAQGRTAVVTCRSTNVDRDGTVLSVVPERPQGVQEPLVSWLFRRTSLRPLGAACGASSLLVPAEVLAAAPLTSLRLHEDWDWVLRASRVPGVVVATVYEPLVTYLDATEGSTASRPVDGWRTSADWVLGAGLPARERGDLLLTVSAALALDAGQRTSALRLAKTALLSCRPGPYAWFGFVLQLLLPAGLLHRAAGVVSRGRAGRRTGPNG